MKTRILISFFILAFLSSLGSAVLSVTPTFASSAVDDDYQTTESLVICRSGSCPAIDRATSTELYSWSNLLTADTDSNKKVSVAFDSTGYSTAKSTWQSFLTSYDPDTDFYAVTKYTTSSVDYLRIIWSETPVTISEHSGGFWKLTSSAIYSASFFANRGWSGSYPADNLIWSGYLVTTSGFGDGVETRFTNASHRVHFLTGAFSVTYPSGYVGPTIEDFSAPPDAPAHPEFKYSYGDKHITGDCLGSTTPFLLDSELDSISDCRVYLDRQETDGDDSVSETFYTGDSTDGTVSNGVVDNLAGSWQDETANPSHIYATHLNYNGGEVEGCGSFPYSCFFNFTVEDYGTYYIKLVVETASGLKSLAVVEIVIQGGYGNGDSTDGVFVPDIYEDCSTYGTDIVGALNCHYGNFLLWITTSLYTFFVPNAGHISDILTNALDEFRDKLGFFGEILTFVPNFFTNLMGITSDNGWDGSATDCTFVVQAASTDHSSVSPDSIFNGADINLDYCTFINSLGDDKWLVLQTIIRAMVVLTMVSTVYYAFMRSLR